MKKSIVLLASILLMIIIALPSCQTSETKVSNAEDKVQDAKEDLADSKQDLYNVRLDTITNYEQFKIEADKIITARENNIIEFKARVASEKKEINADYNTKLDELEKKNNELKKQLEDYKDDGKDKWDSFKNEFNHDMTELGKAFNDLTVDNKK